MKEVFIKKLNPRKKKELLAFLSSLSTETRTRASSAGIDSSGLYKRLITDWKEAFIVGLYFKKELIGIIKIRNTKDSLYLSSLVIKDKYQHQGLGTLLINYSASIALFNKKKKLSAEVLKDNINGVNFYCKNNFMKKKENELIYFFERDLV